MKSRDFDRAAEYYDKTRSWSPEAMAAQAEALTPVLRDRGWTLEIGVGTGRVALPLRDAGLDLIGLDLSRPMMERLIAKAGGRAFPLIEGDATALPLADASIGAAIGCHVLHLIPGWREVLSELIRVVVPGGVFISDLGGWNEGPYDEVQEYFSKAAGIDPDRRFVGVRHVEELDEEMSARGARVRRLLQLVDPRPSTFRQLIDSLEQGLWSFTWPATHQERARAAEVTRTWVENRFGSLDSEVVFELVVDWRAYDLP